ncbi:periplasmic binding protein-like I [Chytridium lagenaria]|nr:periplasmic binding protein-like I [Chytridium lagenaria]
MNYGLQCWWRQLLAFLTAGFFAAVTALVKDGDTINIVLSIPYALTGIYYNDSIGMEVAAEAALRDVMSNPSILPNTKIELIKVNTWDDRYTRPSDAFKYVSGGYASAALYDAITQKNVVGIIGERYSGVTRFAASVASQLEVPFCGPSQTSPAFSDKRNFKYFFRMQPGVGLGNHLSKLLQYFKAANVIIVYSSDNPLSESVRVETEQAFAQNRITISGRFRLTRTMYNTKRFDNIFTSMKTLRTYYIFTILSPGDIDDFYMEASKVGLVGEKYVWFGIAWPLASTLPSSQEKITQSQGYNPAQGPPISRNGQGMYDCMKTILIGIDQIDS